jgi:hypothetical protein
VLSLIEVVRLVRLPIIPLSENGPCLAGFQFSDLNLAFPVLLNYTQHGDTVLLLNEGDGFWFSFVLLLHRFVDLDVLVSLVNFSNRLFYVVFLFVQTRVVVVNLRAQVILLF